MSKINLTIRSASPLPEGKNESWNTVGAGFEEFIDGIIADEIDSETSKKINSSIIPNPWARAHLFHYAIRELSVERSSQYGMSAIYAKLREDLFCMISLIALRKDKIEIKTVELKNSIGDPKNPDYNHYQVKGALGKMLFDEAEYWHNPEKNMDGDSKNVSPRIQLIYYRDDNNSGNKILIGGTSPYTLLFTPPQLSERIEGFYEKTIGIQRWINPLESGLKKDELQAIYNYLKYIKANLNNYYKEVNSWIVENDRMQETGMAAFLNEYMDRILRYSIDADFGRLDARGKIDIGSLFKAPFDTALNASMWVYVHVDEVNSSVVKLYWENFKNDKLNLKRINAGDLLSAERKIFEVGFEKNADPKNCGAYLISTKDENNDRHHFALPFSKTGLRLFQTSVGKLLEDKTNDKKEGVNTYHSIITNIESLRRGEVKVSLDLKVFTDADEKESSVIRLNKIYKIEKINSKKIFIWPNFVSLKGLWKYYYMYSELPHNSEGPYKASPLLADLHADTGIVRIKEKDKDEFMYYEDYQMLKVSSEKELSLEIKDIGTQKIKYEIFKSTIPFYGVEIRLGSDKSSVGGYLVAKIENTSDSNIGAFKQDNEGAFEGVPVGCDFGSNNSCFSFLDQEGNLKLVNFTNRRRALLGSDMVDPNNELEVKSYDMLFFPKRMRNGKIKSMLQIHDGHRLGNGESGIEQVVQGGLPVFETNIPIVELDKKDPNFNYITKMGDEQFTIKYNMKWASSEKNNNYKIAFLKDIWLMICAELFAENKYPNLLRWAYPSAMSETNLIHYNTIWGKVAEMEVSEKIDSEMIKVERITESEAVSKFAMQSSLGNLAPGNDEITIGYDVGGSTTDILVVVKKNGVNTLIRQSSILIAAYPLAKMACSKSSDDVRRAIKEFVLNPANKMSITGINNNEEDKRFNEETGAYFLNALFDKLGDDPRRLEKLYRTFYQKDVKQVFTISAYVTGAILYYSGQLVGQLLQEEEFKHIKKFKKGFFGRGGNIFNWITTVLDVSGRGTAYYHECFLKGMGIPNEKLKEYEINSSYETNDKNKSEVSFGLASKVDIAYDADTTREVIGESGYTFKNAEGKPEELKAFDKIETYHLENLDGDFVNRKGYEKLKEYIEIFCSFIEATDRANANIIRGKMNDLGALSQYVKELPQYSDAYSASNFDFKSPMFILEAMFVLDKIILKHCNL